MGKLFLKSIPSVTSLVFWAGLEVSGIVIPWLGYSLLGLSILLLGIPASSFLSRIRLQWPFTFQQVGTGRVGSFYERGRNDVVYQPSINDLLKEVIGLLVAPWILRVLLYHESQGAILTFTEQSLIDAVTVRFVLILRKKAPTLQEIKADLAWLRGRGLVEEKEELIHLSLTGRAVAKELTPVVTNV